MDEDEKIQHEYEARRVYLPTGPARRFALLMPEMTECEYAGCKQCRDFLTTYDPDGLVSTDKFIWDEEHQQVRQVKR